MENAEVKKAGRPKGSLSKQKSILDLNTLESMKKNLQEEINKLNILKSNLEAQLHTETIKREGEEKLDLLDGQKKVNSLMTKLNSRESNIVTRELSLNDREAAFKERLMQLEKREQDIIDIDKKFAQLQFERMNFGKYKFDIEQKLEQAKITIEEANSMQEKLLAMKEDLKGREISVKNLEKQWHDEWGRLEEEKRLFEIIKQNETKNMEVVNVKS